MAAKNSELSPSERALCADVRNLPRLRKRYSEALYGDRLDLDRAYLLLTTALWWHRDKLIEWMPLSGVAGVEPGLQQTI